ncbi:hypothetical protein [Sutcliffiella sp. NC1]|uniref:hypothetical protein n=1 Tax=Sutcliffiella sp. NC1 TaxID=3004096 RepID=UPI0022DDDD7C|nr:hypothetical protein [Sutcliffiella sp. NC1]WBL16437.1 hypothetical protein O1A01_07330 [Sutcliffiella sp. NC1]
MDIDFSPLQGPLNELALKLAIILFVPFIISIVIGNMILALKLPEWLAKAVGLIIFIVIVVIMLMIFLA